MPGNLFALICGIMFFIRGLTDALGIRLLDPQSTPSEEARRWMKKRSPAEFGICVLSLCLYFLPEKCSFLALPICILLLLAFLFLGFAERRHQQK